jgi:hypothetical protein
MFNGSTETLAAATGMTVGETARALAALNRAGRVMYDVEARDWRHRELFSPPIDVSALFPPNPRKEAAAALLAQPGKVKVNEVQAEEQIKVRQYRDPSTGERIERQQVYRQWRIRGECEGHSTELAVSNEERILFGSCGCAWFKENLLNQGPCEHVLAMFKASEEARNAG